jgi:ribokinase
VIVCFGSINLDLIFPLPRLPTVGQTIGGTDLTIAPGGKGANQAVAAARDGAAVVFAGAVGRDPFAPTALAVLTESGIDLTRVRRLDTATGCAAICVDPQGRNQIAVAAGANFAARQADVEDALLAPGTTVLLQNECAPEETAALIARARARDCRVVLNLAPAGRLPEQAYRDVDVLVVNEDEAAWLGTRLATAPRAASLHAALGVDVVVTLGAAGLEAAARAGRFRLEPHQVAVVDTTGAGDCFTGVLAAALDRGTPFAAALHRANVAAALCCSRQGAQRSMPLAAQTDAVLAPDFTKT